MMYKHRNEDSALTAVFGGLTLLTTGAWAFLLTYEYYPTLFFFEYPFLEKNIKLILWAENTADEYGGKKSLKGKYMTNEWRKYFGVNNNTKIDNWFDKFLNYKSKIFFSRYSNKVDTKKRVSKSIILNFLIIKIHFHMKFHLKKKLIEIRLKRFF